jgi:hypothetical protein
MLSPEIYISVCIETGYAVGRLDFDSQHGKIFLFSTASTPGLGPNQLPIQLKQGAICPGVKRPGREADH